MAFIHLKTPYPINYYLKTYCGLFSNLEKSCESGDTFEIPYSTKELVRKVAESTNELPLPFKKVHISHASVKTKFHCVSGVNLFMEEGAVMVKCPVTGIKEALSIEEKLSCLATWRDYVIFANVSNMWIVDIKDAQVVFGFEKTEANYYPVLAHNDLFYYLLWDGEQVQICCAGFPSSSAKHPGSNDISDSFNQTLTSQDTLKAQLNTLRESITTATKPANVLPQLQSLFEAIDDLSYLIETMEKLCQNNLNYKSILYPLQKRIFASNDNDLINMVSDLSIKIDLVEYIQFTGNNSYENVNLFEQNYKELCITFISKQDFDIASICWLKYSQLKLPISPDDVVNILNAISNTTKIASIIIWLKNFVPSLLEQNPFYIDIFVRWATERVFMLEQSAYWPKIGVKFVEEITVILETSFKSISVRPISMDDLDLLKTRISYIIELKEKYKINMLLNELSSQSPNEVALIMLRRCYTEDLEMFLQNYLPSYAMQCLFDMDDILISYIESEAASSGGGIDGTRLKMLLEAFHSYNNKLECLLQVLKVLDVPWNPSVLDLAVATVADVTKNFTTSDTERLLSLEIQKEINYANVKVVLKKYNFPMSCTDYLLVLHKIVSAPVIELDDLNVITSVMPVYTNYGNVLYIERCLQDCETKTALNYFNNLSTKDKKLLLRTVVAKYDQIINGQTNNMTIERNYIDFIKGTQLLNETELNNIETLYHFKNSYNLLLSINEIYNESACENTVSTWIREDGATASSGRGGSVIQLTQACQSQHSILMSLLRSTSTCHEVRKLVEYLIRLFSKKDVSADDFMAILSQFKFGENSKLLLDSYNVLIELAASCSEEYLHNLMSQLSLLNTLINASIIVKNLSIAWKFHYIFLPISSSTAINDLINFYKNKQYPEDSSADLLNVHSKCDFTSLRLISNILLDGDIIKNCSDDLSELTKRLLGKVVTSQELDEVLITSLLLVIRAYEEDSSWVLDVLRGQNEFLPHHILCYLSSPPIRRTFVFDNDSFNKEIGNSVTYPPQYILKSKFNINLADVALPENSEETWDVKVILFYVLLQFPDTPFDRLVEFCRSLNISTNDGLSLQLIALLSTWELKYKIITDDLGHQQISIENDESQLNKCFVVWDSIENKDLLKDILNDFWKDGEITLHGRVVSINPYYYEVFLCIYRLIFGTTCEIRNTKEYFLLHFLKEYKRKSTPKQYEYELFSVKGMFPEIGHFRLPFHLFMREDMWANLKSEITLETYERWLPAVALLSLDSNGQTARDMICSNAVKQTMTNRKRNEEADTDTKHEPWRLTSQEEPLLRAAHRCVRHIANMEWAGACLFYVLQGCARGADQVAAAHLCYQFAQRWAALQPGNRAVRQMERLHSTLSTRHALHKIDWACEEFLRLSTEPAQLIRTLYLHSDFVSKMNRHDVNRAVNEIADKNGINVSSIRIQILENILDKSNADNKNITVLNIKELMTAKFILKATCPKMGAIYLSRIAFDDESDNNKSKKLRALQCLMSVVDSDTAIKVANKERDALWLSLLELFSIVNLESVDMPWIAATFAHDKNRGLEQLLQAVEGNADGLKIAAQLACRFGSAQIIRSLIPLLLRAGLFEEMIPLLLKLTSQLDNIICSAWRAVILSPFQRADYPITERQRIKCLNAINLLPICPLIKDEDLVEIWKNCLRCKCFGLGCLVLPYMTSQTRQKLTELQKIDRRNLIASLKNLHSETYLVSGAMHVIERMASRAYR
ncbi:kinetochore component rough deal isoform X2 [Anticarsia gemmatalis]|uniref:kinetochore component rough deal isoform X2 n=1 Tax=Anticarsia gemmatalis TaxID=129554 RepID=UPI003F76E190